MKTVVSANNTNTTNAQSIAPAVVTIITKTEPAGDVAGNANAAIQFQTPTSTALTGAAAALKRPASLDLNKVTTAAKKRLVGPTPLLLDSADLPNPKTVNTPDIEKFLLSSNLLQTPQPGLVFPTKVGPVTSEQEAFGKGFEEALHNLHTSKSSQLNTSNTSSSGNTDTSSNITVTSTATTTATTGMSGGSFTYTNLENFPIAIKDEPQQPTSPPVSPIDMETQEKIKLERKRQRNRVAASKCRKRKLERISKLEEKVKILKGENTDLGSVVKTLKDHVAQLKQKVIEHIESGCSIPNIFNSSTILQGK